MNLLLWTFRCKFLCAHVVISLRSETAASYGNSMFNIVKHRKTACLPNQPHHFTCTPVVHEASNFSTFLSHLSLFLDYSHSVGVQWYFIMALIFISMLVNNGEHLSMCLLPICIYIYIFFFLRTIYTHCSFFKTLRIFKSILIIQISSFVNFCHLHSTVLQSGTYTVSTVLLPFSLLTIGAL